MATESRFSALLTVGAELGSSFRATFKTAGDEANKLGDALRAAAKGRQMGQDYTEQQSAVDKARAAMQAEQKRLIEMRNQGGTFKSAEDYAKIFVQAEKVDKAKAAFARQHAAMIKMRESMKKAGIDVNNLTASLAKLEAEADRAGAAAKRAEAWGKIGNAWGNVKSRALSAGAALGAVGFGAWKLVSGFAEAGDEAEETAMALGMTYKELMGLRYAGSTVGVSAEKLDQALNAVNQRLSEAQDGSEKAAASFEALGLDAEQLGAMNAAQRISALSNAFKAIPDKARRAALAADIFGSKNFKVANILALGSKELKRLREEGEKSGYIMSDEKRAKAAKFSDEMDRFKGVLIGLRNEAGARLLPVLSKFIEYATEHPWILKAGFGIAAAAAGGSAINSVVKLGGSIVSLGRAFGVVGKLVGIGGAAGGASFFPAIIGGFKAVGAALMAIPGPGWVVAAIVAAIAAAGFAVYKYWQPISAYMGGVFKGIREEAAATWLDIKKTFYLDEIWEWSKPVRDWLGEFFTQTKFAREELDKFSSAGERWGRTMFKAATRMLSPILQVIDGIKEVKRLFGIGQDVTAANDAKVPKLSTSAPTKNVSNTYHLQVHAGPGQNADEIAEAALRKLRDEEERNDRSSMLDMAPAY